jgi:uncharacterized protein (DUF486 family)
VIVVVGVPALLALSSVVMALAWLGHLRFQHWGYGKALLASWFLVLPEYLLNVFATRWGHGVYSGTQMAALNLSSGVVFVALVSHIVLREDLSRWQWAGFGLMIVSVGLIFS